MKKLVITCPRCGAEYLMQEIYLPNSFLGKASYIEKDPSTHQITEILGTDVNTEEEYTCDFCGAPFIVNAKISFCTRENTKKDFDNDYVTVLKKEKILLSED